MALEQHVDFRELQLLLAAHRRQPQSRGGFDVGYSSDILAGADLVEMVQVAYAPSGDLWAAFVRDMCPGRGNGPCDWDVTAHAGSKYQGALGRVVHGKP